MLIFLLYYNKIKTTHETNHEWSENNKSKYKFKQLNYSTYTLKYQHINTSIH